MTIDNDVAKDNMSKIIDIEKNKFMVISVSSTGIPVFFRCSKCRKLVSKNHTRDHRIQCWDSNDTK